MPGPSSPFRSMTEGDNGTSEKTVLVTGANTGIGLATVLELARRGFHTIGTVRSDAKADVVNRAAADAGVAVETRHARRHRRRGVRVGHGRPRARRAGEQRRLRHDVVHRGHER